MNKIPYTVAVDFDGVLSKYDGWKGNNIFGKPIPEMVKTIRQLKKEGYYIIIFTTRQDTTALRKWLKDNKVPYDDINKNRYQYLFEGSSCKPFWHCYIGDRAVHFERNMAGNNADSMMKCIKRVVNEAMKGEGK